MAGLERRNVQTLSLRKVVYHRLDLQLNNDIRTHCTLMDQLSTIGTRYFFLRSIERAEIGV